MDFINLQADVQLVVVMKPVRAKESLTCACVAAKMALYQKT
jgi:hypothetical protein